MESPRPFDLPEFLVVFEEKAKSYTVQHHYASCCSNDEGKAAETEAVRMYKRLVENAAEALLNCGKVQRDKLLNRMRDVLMGSSVGWNHLVYSGFLEKVALRAIALAQASNISEAGNSSVGEISDETRRRAAGPTLIRTGPPQGGGE